MERIPLVFNWPPPQFPGVDSSGTLKNSPFLIRQHDGYPIRHPRMIGVDDFVASSTDSFGDGACDTPSDARPTVFCDDCCDDFVDRCCRERADRPMDRPTDRPTDTFMDVVWDTGLDRSAGCLPIRSRGSPEGMNPFHCHPLIHSPPVRPPAFFPLRLFASSFRPPRSRSGSSPLPFVPRFHCGHPADAIALHRGGRVRRFVRSMVSINALSKTNRADAPCSLPLAPFGGTGFQRVKAVFNHQI